MLKTPLKRTLTALALTLAAAAAKAQTAGCITVEVQNVRPQQGLLMAAAFVDAASFGKKSVAEIKVPAGDAVTRFEMCGISGDSVAITMYQDLDSDGKMNRNILGIPSEPWGSSGNPGPFGPNWESGRVPLDGKVVVVKLTA